MIARRGSSSSAADVQDDVRSVETIVQAAAARLGVGEDATPVVEAMHAQGVRWAWQLQFAEDWNWMKYGASDGLTMACKSELRNPSVGTDGELSERLRQFLLLKGADGSPVRRMYRTSAFLTAVLLAPLAERQKLLLTLFEVLALVSGLTMPLPLAMMRHLEPSDWAHKADQVEGPWGQMPDHADVMDALLCFCFAVSSFSLLVTVLLALFTTVSGWRATSHYMEMILPITGAVFHIFVLLGLLPILYVCIWKLFVVAKSPYPMLASAVSGLFIWNVFMYFLWDFCLSAMALEFYHMPRWFMTNMKITQPFIAHKISDRRLEPIARARAARLRAVAGVREEDVTEDRRGGKRPFVV